MEKYELITYDKEQIEEFKNQIERDKKNSFIPISYFLDDKLNLKYTGINDADELYVDITALILSVEVRNDLYLVYEGWINALIDKNKDDIYFCIERKYLKKACEIFFHYFEYNEDDFTMDVIEDSHSSENIELNEENYNSIVNYEQSEFDLLISKFNSELYGHNDFKINLERQLKAFILLHKMKRAKIFSILLCGKSGVGKTEVGRLLHNFMYPNEKMIKINFGNYSGKGSLWSLIGSPKGYVGSEKGGELSKKIEGSKAKIIIIDELDKADESIFTFFYEMLEDGQFTDLDNKVYNLDGYIAIFTANLTNENFKEKIPEPLFSRFDMTYEFIPLSVQDKITFVNDFTNKLLSDYCQYISQEINNDDIKNKMFSIDFCGMNNLRNIKRGIMNEFIDIVGTNELWNKQTVEKEDEEND